VTMQELAHSIWVEMNRSVPKVLKPGEWHLPYVNLDNLLKPLSEVALDLAKKVSVARCARISYKLFDVDAPSDLESDLALYTKLLAGPHWSSFEHQATPDEIKFNVVHDHEYWANRAQWGNFTGWRQYRKMFNTEAVKPLPANYR